MTRTLSPALLELIANRFKVLAEPARLDLLHTLKKGELTVTELVDRTGMGQANVSKHLQLLLAHGFVVRRKEGLFAYYALADKDVLKLCDIMCARLETETHVRRRIVTVR